MTSNGCQYILDNPEKPWSWAGLSRNPNITLDIVLKHPEKPWDWAGLSWNKMDKYQFPLCVLKRSAKERTAVFKEELIQKIFHPSRVEKYIDYYGLDWDEYV